VAASESELLASDAILNYKTVASFGSDEIILDKYKSLIDAVAHDHVKKSYVHGVAFGFSQFVVNFYLAGLYYSAATLMKNNPYPEIEPNKIF
jgi:ABC-type transport system involved in Fe-S cluster assembly fused permease/ATPase subunit